MLNVNKILIFLTISIFTSSLHAVDVLNFDIKGIKLGMSKSQILKKMPCSPEVENPWADVPTHLIGNAFKLTCKYTEKNNEEELTVYLNHAGIAINIHRTITFISKPNQDNINTKLMLKYGETNNIKRGRVFTWGKRNKIFLQTWFMSTGDELKVLLQDKEKLEINDKLISNKMKKYNLKNSKESSSIDF